jgi:hypothetical protein
MVGFSSVPEFHPTLEEFSDFSKYVRSLEKDVLPQGCALIHPPSEWKARASYRNVRFEIEHPVKQHAIGERGIYKV